MLARVLVPALVPALVLMLMLMLMLGRPSGAAAQQDTRAAAGVSAASGSAGRAAHPAPDSGAGGDGERVSLGDVVLLPVVFGFRAPSYDRSDGLSLPWGPQLALPDDRVVANVLAIYRSHLGRVDPRGDATVEVTRRMRLRALLERATLTNDAWSVNDVFNSLAMLFVGLDGRNYFRADRIEGALEWHGARTDESERWRAYLGARDELGASVGPGLSPTHEVWALFDRRDRHGNIRPNPAIERGRIVAAIAGVAAHWRGPTTRSADASVELEAPWSAPRAGRSEQLTADGRLAMPALGATTLAVTAHAVLTAGGPAPPQRFSYLGGLNTLPTLPLLARGGDELLFLDALYTIPLRALALPLVGAPSIGPHYIVGGAAVHRLPRLAQNVGVRASFFVLEVDGLVDPATRRTVFTVGGALPTF